MIAPESNPARLSVLVAHGSRVDAANAAHVERCARLDSRLPGATVRAAFLELATPDVGSAIDAGVADGFTEITLHPFFLHDGKHTTVDLPGIVTLAERRHPSIELVLGDHLGHRDELDAMLLDILAAATS